MKKELNDNEVIVVCDLGRNEGTKAYKDKNLRPECLSVEPQIFGGSAERDGLFFIQSLRGRGDLRLSSHHGFYHLSEKIIANQ